MAPDIDELIRKVNTLTLDKNRLRQKLVQLSHSTSANKSEPTIKHQNSSEICDLSGKNSDINKTPTNCSSETSTTANNIIAGIECSSSSEDDLIYVNELYKKRLDEYNENWDYVQSKCAALLSELHALQKRYALLQGEKLEAEERYKLKCDDYDKIQAELQTVVLNYETQLSAMSDHLSNLANRVSLDDHLDGGP